MPSRRAGILLLVFMALADIAAWVTAVVMADDVALVICGGLTCTLAVAGLYVLRGASDGYPVDRRRETVPVRGVDARTGMPPIGDSPGPDPEIAGELQQPPVGRPGRLR